MQTETRLIVGKKGSGKTTYALNLVRNLTRVIVADAGFEEFPFKTVSNFSELCQEVRNPFFRVSYTPRYSEWSHLLSLARAVGETGGPLWLVIEEASRLPSSRECREAEELFIMGRHWGINLVGISTRPRHLSPDFRAGCTHLTAFTCHEPADLQYLADIIGERAFELPTLPRFHPLEWNDREDISDGISSSSPSRNSSSSPSPSTTSKKDVDKEEIIT